jgi:hypothetical protein
VWRYIDVEPRKVEAWPSIDGNGTEEAPHKFDYLTGVCEEQHVSDDAEQV